MRYQTVLFDLDGTLLDTRPGIIRSMKATLDRLGVAYPPEESIDAFMGPPLRECFTDVCGLSDDLADKAVKIYRRHLVESGGVYNCNVYPGIPELLGKLKSAGCRLGVATSKATWLARDILLHKGLAAFFDTISGAPEQGGTKAEVIRQALARLASGKDGTVLVGDRKFDAQGARETGIDCIGIQYGYGTAAELSTSAFTAVLPTVDSLGHYLGVSPVVHGKGSVT